MLLIIFIIIFITLLIIYRTKLIKNNYLKLLSKYLLISLGISTILELTIFNYRFYESLFFTNNSKEITDYTYIDGITCEGKTCKIKEDTSYIEITNLDTKVNNIELKLNSDKLLITKFNLSFTDDSNTEYLNAGSRVYSKGVTRSHYFRLEPSGNVHKIRLEVKETNANFTIESIKLNTQVPFFISSFRLLLILVISLFIMIINPLNKLHELSYDFKHHKKLTIVIVIALSIIFSLSTFANSESYNFKKDSHIQQYDMLAVSLAHGKFSLDLPVTDKLLSLDNPYDPSERNNLKRNADYYWDCAYYNGKYYSYFGIVPCLLTYLPFYLVTHHDLPNVAAMCIFITIFISSCFYLVYQIINKYFKKTSYIWYLLLSIFFTIASGLISFASYPILYNMPIITGLSFAILGLAFWLKSTNSKKLNSKYLFLGSLCMAIVAGCRPQLLLSSFFAIPIFSDYIFKKRELFSKKSIKETILFILPYLVIALALCYYNASRFGSIIDFGANYNLTTNDMTRRGFKLDRIFLGIYYFLLAPTKITPIFPFIEKAKLSTMYLGKTISESLYGGFLFINLISILGILSFKFKKVIEDKKLYKLSILSVIFALIIVIADTQMAGILPRYISDFAWLINLSTIIVLLSLLDKNILNKDFKKLIVILIMFSLISNCLIFFTESTILSKYNVLKTIYYYIYHSFMFWL